MLALAGLARGPVVFRFLASFLAFLPPSMKIIDGGLGASANRSCSMVVMWTGSRTRLTYQNFAAISIPTPDLIRMLEKSKPMRGGRNRSFPPREFFLNRFRL